MGATADMERVAPQWSKQYKDKHGAEKIRVARIDVVAPVQETDSGENENGKKTVLNQNGRGRGTST